MLKKRNEIKNPTENSYKKTTINTANKSGTIVAPEKSYHLFIEHVKKFF
jgi:hypothetical protein